MSTSYRGPIGRQQYPVCEASTPGTLGLFDRADPNVLSLPGDSPGPTGFRDRSEQISQFQAPVFQSAAPESQDTEVLSEAPVSGAIPVGVGQPSIARIPVPGSNKLFVELSPRGYVPKSGSTSTLFIQDKTGKRHLRLDYGYNKNTGQIDYHWNQKGTHQQFGIPDHAAAGKGGHALYKTAKYLKYGGRVLVVLGVAIDVYSIVVAEKRWRQVSKVVAGWAGAWGGCKLVGGGLAVAGSAVPGKGTAIFGLAGCIAGGVGGYLGASWAAEEAYDVIEETFFKPLPETVASD